MDPNALLDQVVGALWGALGWAVIAFVAIALIVTAFRFLEDTSRVVSISVIVGLAVCAYGWYLPGLLGFRILGATAIAVGLALWIIVGTNWRLSWSVASGIVPFLMGVWLEAWGNVPYRWPLSVGQWIWSTSPLVGGLLVGWIVALVNSRRRRMEEEQDAAAQRVREKQHDLEVVQRNRERELADREAREKQRAADQVAAAAKAKQDAQEAQERAEQELAQRKKEAQAASTAALKAEADALRARQELQERLRISDLEASENRAVQDAMEADSARIRDKTLTPASIQDREHGILQNVFALTRGLRRVPLEHVATDLPLGQVLLDLRSLAQGGFVKLSYSDPRTQWTDIEVELGDQGRQKAMTGPTNNNYFQAPVTTQNIGPSSGPISAGAVGANNTINGAKVGFQNFESGLAQLGNEVAAIEGQLAISEAQELRTQLDELSHVHEPAKRRSALKAIANAASSIGAIAAPVLKTATELMEMVDPRLSTGR